MRVPTQITPRTRRSPEGRSFVRNAGTAGPESGIRLAQGLMQAGQTLGTVGGLLTEQATKAQRFGTLQSYSAFTQEVDKKFEELKRSSDPAQGNFADQAMAVYSNMETEWLKTVPDIFHDEFKTRAADTKAAAARAALAFQYERTDAFFKQGVTEAVDNAQLSLDQDGSLANLDRQRALIDEFIDATDLTEAEKTAQRRTAYQQIESTSYISEVTRERLDVGALGVGSAPGRAADLIATFDGTSMENGLSYEENTDLLAGRVTEAEQIAVEGVGSLERWMAMPDRARAALISLTDDLGELPASVKKAVDEGDLMAVATAVAELGGDRRTIEAQTILGTRDMPEGRLDADPRFANIPYEDRLALRADAERRAAAMQTAEAKAAKAANDAAVNDLMNGLVFGDYGQFEIDQAVESGVLSDYDARKKAQDALDKGDNQLRLIQEGQQKISLGIEFNPDSKKDRDMLNAMVGPQGIVAIQNMDENFVRNILIPLGQKSKDLPTEAVGQLTGMMRSNDPQRALFALDTLAQLEQSSPAGYQARVKEADAADVEYWQTVKDYYPQEEVFATIRGGTTQEERTRVTMLREEARKLVKDGDVAPNLVSALGDLPQWRMGDPATVAGTSQLLASDFNQLFEREYSRDGNSAAAEQRAIKALSRVWHTTGIGGEQLLMRYPPELAGYPTWNQSYDWMTEQGRTELGLDGGTTFQLISDEQTKSELQNWQGGAGEAPSYLVVYKDETGNLVTPRDETGKVKRLFFEITPEMEAEKLAITNNSLKALDDQAFLIRYNAALHHSLSTGTPIPPAIQQEYEDRTNAVP